MTMINDFYPTPKTLIDKMLAGINFEEIEYILEPSAGKGDICDAVKERLPYHRRRDGEIDVIEMDEDLQHLLKGKEYQLIQDDFLTFETNKAYDLIIANFPFSNGDRHLQKALALLEQGGGNLVCVVNAETIKNPYTNLRLSLVRRLETLGANIQYLQEEFTDAERKTKVEIALIKLSIEKTNNVSVILDSLKKAKEVGEDQDRPEEGLIEKNFMKALVARFDVEAKLGIRLIDEYFALKPYIMSRIPKKGKEVSEYATGLIELKVEQAHGARTSYVNSYLRGVRYKYWELLINDERFYRIYTSNILKDLNNKLSSLRDYDFNLFNIRELEKEMNSKISGGVEKAILDLFETFTHSHSYDQDFNNGNIHYYNGWKTNKAHKVNHKVIIPFYGRSSWDFSLSCSGRDQLRDMVKVFNYLADNQEDVLRLADSAIADADHYKDYNGIDLRYFETKLYKKGTCHIKFKDQKLLDKFNIFGSQRKGWLPPSYGKKSYVEMDAEEKAVVDDFQGKEKYDEVMMKADYYLVKPGDRLQLTGEASDA
jgi:phospholipid N-methyltransferase